MFRRPGILHLVHILVMLLHRRFLLVDQPVTMEVVSVNLYQDYRPVLLLHGKIVVPPDVLRLKLPHILLSDPVRKGIRARRAAENKVRQQRNEYFRQQAIEKAIERSREKQLHQED